MLATVLTIITTIWRPGFSVIVEFEFSIVVAGDLLQTKERLRNENEDKTKTQMTQSFNQYSENETKI